MDQFITASLDWLKSIVVNDDISEDDYNSGYKSRNDSEVDIFTKITSDTIVKKKNVLDLKVVKQTIHKDYLRLFVLDNFEDEIYQDSVTLKPKSYYVNYNPRLKLGPLNISRKIKIIYTH